MSEVLDTALLYAGRGWRVFPLHAPRKDGSCSCGKGDECPSPAKHPRTKNGLKDATTDPQKIHSWWKRPWNVGLVTGETSGLVVLDVDPEHGGETTLEDLEAEHGALPTTARALTGGEGWHYLFKHPGEKVRNNAGTKLGPGLDVRGDGGYIVAAPSRHITGNRYEWLGLPDELPELPEWLLERIREQPAPERSPAPKAARNGTGSSKYGLEALEREASDVARAVEGTRNHTLNRAAFSLGQLVAGGELEEHLVVDTLQAAGSSAGLIPAEISQTLRSGLESGMRDPRSAPPPRVPITAGRTATSIDDEEPPPPPPEEEHREEDADPPASFDDTDLGNARRLVDAHGTEIRYVPQWGSWLIWNGARWRRDTTGQIERFAKRVAESILVEAFHEPDDDKRKRRVKFAFDSQRRARLEAMVALARTEPGMPVEPHDLDADPWLLNVANGTIELKTGQLREHRQGDLITKLAPVKYDPGAMHDTWDAFLETISDGVFELAAFLQRAVGYSLTGDTGEEVLFFVHGPAAAGKSTFIDAIEATLGDYARRADFETFLARNQGSAGSARGDIARLAGARYVVSVEVDEGAKLAEGLVKTLTGGDLITARFLYKDEFEFRPAFKLWLAANHAPRVRHGDEAIWRRILRIPFEHVIPKESRDPDIKTTLRDPADAGPAILAWAIQGCLHWKERGLDIPDVVTTATSEYRADMDPLGDFLQDCCTFHPEQWVSAGALRKAYDDWAHDNGLRATLSPKAFKETLEEHGARSDRRRTQVGGQPQRVWDGVGLLSIHEAPPGGPIDDPGPDDDYQPELGA